MQNQPIFNNKSQLLSRRKFCLLALGLGFSGCTKGSSLSYVADSFRLITSGFPDIPLTRAQVDSIPYATLTAKMGKGPRSLLVLGRVNGQDLHWISNDKKALVSRHGRIIKTAGFSLNLINTRFLSLDPVQGGLFTASGQNKLTRIVDLMPGNHFGVSVMSQFSQSGEEQIEIVEKRYKTRLIRERCSVPELTWSFDNYYWVDKSGFIWKSEQHFAPTLPPVQFEILTPYIKTRP